MSRTIIVQSEQATDRAITLRNRARLGANKNLLFWYRELYRDQFKDFPNPAALSILEIGSGTSPLKQFLSNVVTSDVLNLDYLDLVFDCHEIDKLDAIKENSLDVITLTNVLHHLKSPIVFLNRAATKLKSGGKVIATEPFFSMLSTSRSTPSIASGVRGSQHTAALIFMRTGSAALRRLVVPAIQRAHHPLGTRRRLLHLAGAFGSEHPHRELLHRRRAGSGHVCFRPAEPRQPDAGHDCRRLARSLRSFFHRDPDASLMSRG